MATWEDGKSDMPCQTCGAVHVVQWKDYPERDKGVVTCLVPGCDGIVKKWKGTRDYGPAALKID